MNTILIFRFDCAELTQLDAEILTKISKNANETNVVESTPYGTVIVTQTLLSVNAILFKYRLKEKYYKVKLPVLVFNLTETELDENASFFNLNSLMSRIPEVKTQALKNKNRKMAVRQPKSIDELLDQIHAEGIVSLTKMERIQLDECSKKLIKNDKK
jgi:hypothetical protein